MYNILAIDKIIQTYEVIRISSYTEEITNLSYITFIF